MTDATTAQLLAEVERHLTDDYLVCDESVRGAYRDLGKLVGVIRRQDARIAALEAARAPHGLPLEGTGPLPLERKTGVIPGRPGQEVNSGGDTFIPPLRPTPPRKEAR